MLENYWPAIACLFPLGRDLFFFARKKAFGSNIWNTSKRTLGSCASNFGVGGTKVLHEQYDIVFRHGKDEKVLPAMPQVDARTQPRLYSCANSFLQPSTSISGAWKTGNSGNPATMDSHGIWLDCWLFMLNLNLRQFCSKGCVLWSYTVGFVSKSDTCWHVFCFFRWTKQTPCVDIAIELDELLWKTFAEAKMLWYLNPENISELAT